MNLDLLELVKEHVRSGRAKSRSEFAEEALRARLKQIDREGRVKSLERASKGPVYLADIGEIERDFRFTDAEAARMIE